MSLIDSRKEPFKKMLRVSIADGEGGETTAWSEGGSINIACVRNSSAEARTAEKLGVKSLYMLYFERNAAISYGDYVKRVSDNAIFRVTSYPEEMKTPEQMAIPFMNSTAERTELP